MAILAATLIAGCSKPEPVAHEEKPRPVRSMVVKASDGSERWTLAGDIRPRIEVRYGFRVGGRLIERKVETGDQIKAGQVLARLDPTDLQPMLDAQRAQQEAARTELALARADLTRAERLRAGNFVSDANVDRSRAAVDAAKARLEAATAQVDQARNSLGFQVLRADTPGVVTAVDAEAGQVVAVGQSVVRIARAGEIEVAVAVPEQDMDRVRRVAQWTVTLPSVPGRDWSATLRELSPSADPASRTYLARLTLTGDLEPVALGMSANVSARIVDGARIEIPLSALYSLDDSTRVWVVDPGKSTVSSRKVKTGRILDTAVVVTEGLAAGDRVVTAGANLLREGQQVRLVEAARQDGGAR